LFWTAEEIVNVKSILVQRSADGANFETLGEVPESAILHNNTYTDNNPLSRGNYYRLVTVNLDGSKEYSNTLLLTRHDNFKITAYPVPAKNTVYVDVSGLSQGNYVLTLSNAAGQRLKEVNSYISGVGKVINVNTSGLAAGIYFLHLADQKGIIIYHSPVVIN
jgi:glutaredoxin 2